jgi:hypothetical protein
MKAGTVLTAVLFSLLAATNADAQTKLTLGPRSRT